MNWEAIGAIAESLGAIGVIATLAYLAQQIRHNTSMGRSAAATATSQATSSLNFLLAQDLDANRTYWKGLASPRELSDDERLRFIQLMSITQINIQQSYSLFQEGALSASNWRSHYNSLLFFVTQPGFLEFWEEWGRLTVPEFRDLVNETIEQAEAAAAQHLSDPSPSIGDKKR